MDFCFSRGRRSFKVRKETQDCLICVYLQLLDHSSGLFIQVCVECNFSTLCFSNLHFIGFPLMSNFVCLISDDSGTL